MDELERDLLAALRGDVRFDAVSRALYAADASIYQVEPRGVVAPRDDGDLLAALRLARRHRTPVTARGGATSLAGQSVGAGLQLDTVPYFHRIREIDPAARRAVVQPGLVLETLNQALLPHGLWFAPDVSPANRATVGGMIGNNSCGMHSIVYGKTVDHVEALDVILGDGTLIRAAPLSESDYAAKLAQPGREGEIYRGLRAIVDRCRPAIAARFPAIMRRVGGYNLDRLAASPTCNLVDLLVGSEGTLALTRQAALRLEPRPAVTGTCVLHFGHLFDAADAVPSILAWRPAAVELMDALLLRLADQSPVYGPAARQFVRGAPGAVLLVEFFGGEAAAVRERCREFAAAMARDGISATATISVDPAERAAILAVRKASLPLLMGMAPDRKPQTCVEDSAVAPERLGAYVRRFAAIVAAHGTEASFNGHASVGLLHVRPLLNLRDPGDVRKLRSLAEAVRDLALEFGGAVSGEHGDGRLRSEFNERVFGPELYAAFREVKRLFDPDNLLNPGMITAAPPLDADLRPPPSREIATTYRFADAGGLANAVELCNGNGLCRKPAGGTMCPSFMATRQERDSTRGRANALRAIVSGALPAADLAGDGLHAVLDLCLECKACTAECPSGVNMTRLKSEALSQRHAARGAPLRSRLFGAARLVHRLGAAAAPVSNWLLGAP
ncbi:MAG TPA: FAD-binding and (Fe-S)-binding domain-containing protein, partial [Herpetosiphonaceae bacterium]